jgi:predicted nucleic acid-binding protein
MPYLTTAIDTEMIQEILYRYGSLKRWDIAVKMADSLFDLIPIVFPVIPEDARLAVRLLSHYAPLGIPARDLIHVAVMQSNQISHLISTDEHFDRIEGITRHDPVDMLES